MVELRSTSSGTSSSGGFGGYGSSSECISSSGSCPSGRSKTSSNQRASRSSSSRQQLIPMLRYFSLYLLFLAFSAQSGSAEVLVANYDNIEHQLNVFDERVKKALTLSCNISQSGYTLSWFRNDIAVGEDPQLKGRFVIKHSENSFVIAKPDEKDAGKYTCSVPELKESKIFNVVANVFFKNMPDNVAVVEGEKLTIHCIAFGTDPKISWVVGNTTFTESGDHIKLSADENGIENAILTIESAVLSDREFYNCTATNLAIQYGNAGYKLAEEATYVRVKGKLAALWPFLGICAEVFILCAIILVYEKRRNKAEMDESDTDQSPEQEKLKEKK